jgi:hypothetical protein
MADQFEDLCALQVVLYMSFILKSNQLQHFILSNNHISLVTDPHC